jgi:hypothetical protein
MNIRGTPRNLRDGEKESRHEEVPRHKKDQATRPETFLKPLPRNEGRGVRRKEMHAPRREPQMPKGQRKHKKTRKGGMKHPTE